MPGKRILAACDGRINLVFHGPGAPIMVTAMKRALIALFLLCALAPGARAAAGDYNLWQDFPWAMTPTSSTELASTLALIATQNWALALTTLNERIAGHPDDGGALHLSGLLFWQAGNREEATRQLVRATRAPDHQSVTIWALAALSSSAHSHAEAVGWIKRAAREVPEAEVGTWLKKAYFSSLCEFPPYRELLDGFHLSGLCPSARIVIPRSAHTDAAAPASDFLEQPGPVGSLRLSVQDGEAKGSGLKLAVPDGEEPAAGPLR